MMDLTTVEVMPGEGKVVKQIQLVKVLQLFSGLFGFEQDSTWLNAMLSNALEVRQTFESWGYGSVGLDLPKETTHIWKVEDLMV